MTTYEYVAASIAGAAISVPIVTWIVLWLIRRDRIFANVAPVSTNPWTRPST